MQSLKCHDFCQKFQGRQGGQHDQNFVKNKCIKKRVGGREVNLNLDNVFKYAVFVFFRVPLSGNKNVSIFFLLRRDFFSQKKECSDQKNIQQKLTGWPKNREVDICPDPIGHFEAAYRQFWQAVSKCPPCRQADILYQNNIQLYNR